MKNQESLISTNTVFHFTSSINNLESILVNDFYPQFCVEDFLGTILNIEGAEKALPMVCFCDIPLFQIKKHTETYGDYAIGLSKEWAIKQKVNPVLYAYPNSDFSNKLKKALLQLYAHDEDKGHDFSTQFSLAIQYIKPYEGKLWKNGQWTEKVIRFYDEREWRYVPETENLNLNGRPFWLDSSTTKDPEKINNLNELIREKRSIKKLSFVPNDIKFIIVKSEEEILPMVDKVIQIKRNKFSYKDVQILTTRIISMESIRENF